MHGRPDVYFTQCRLSHQRRISPLTGHAIRVPLANRSQRLERHLGQHSILLVPHDEYQLRYVRLEHGRSLFGHQPDVPCSYLGRAQRVDAIRSLKFLDQRGDTRVVDNRPRRVVNYGRKRFEETRVRLLDFA
jgi:hypothetical protein